MKYDRISCAEYARKYAINPNTPKYYNFDHPDFGKNSDCANFASQCIHEGGKIPTISNVWQYYPNRTETWAGVEKFMAFISK